MKRLLLLLLLIPTVSAAWFYDSEQVDVNLDISSKALIERQQDSNLEYIKVNLTFVPEKSSTTKILSMTTTPKAEFSKGSALYSFDNTTEDSIYFSFNSDLRLINKIKRIGSKVPFPIKLVPQEYIVYTQPSPTIDSDNQEIFELANELASGETDLFMTTFNLASWVRENIDYSLSSLTASVSQRSSWVIKTRQGVCDELTNLFIALCRSLGIPARFVSGISYTNSEEFPESWGPHGWAEVYFPGYGWIPYDVTYGQYGFVDPTHIKLKASQDAQEPSTRYKWFGYNIEVDTSPLNITTKLLQHSGKVPETISLDSRPFTQEASFGSYNIVETTIKNLKNYYQATELSISYPEELEIIGNSSVPVALQPNQKKALHFLFRVPKNLDPNYRYLFPASVFTLKNITSSTGFNASRSGTTLSLQEAESILTQKQSSQEKQYTKSMILVCTPEKPEFYGYEDVKANCNINNNGNTLIDDLSICLGDSCNTISLGISEQKKLSYALPKTKVSKQVSTITASSKDLSESSYIEYTVLDIPKVNITSLKHPSSVSYEDLYKVSFILNKQSYSTPQDLILTLDYGLKKQWTLSELPGSKHFDITLPADELSVGSNVFTINLDFKDKNKKQYTYSKDFQIILNNPTFTQRIRIFFTDIGKFIINLIQ